MGLGRPAIVTRYTPGGAKKRRRQRGTGLRHGDGRLDPPATNAPITAPAVPPTRPPSSHRPTQLPGTSEFWHQTYIRVPVRNAPAAPPIRAPRTPGCPCPAGRSVTPGIRSRVFVAPVPASQSPGTG